ncbi:MAG: cyclase family protein [Sphaerochaeta sp.]|nr:cyclase family protein [Sphaerochaeta sp.]
MFKKPNDSTQIVDLSMTFAMDSPVYWPTHHAFEQKSWRSFSAGDGYQTNYFIMDEHTGTHCDAPAHFIRPEDNKGPSYYGDTIPLLSMMGPLAIIDVTSLRPQGDDGTSPEIPPQFIQVWEEKHGDIKKGTIVAFRTDWDLFLDSPEMYDKYVLGPVVLKNSPGWPVPSIETISYLYGKNIKCFAIDAPSMGASNGGEALHQFSLGKNLVFIEGLINLSLVDPRGYDFIFLPLKLANSTGCPGRAIAMKEVGV